MKIKKDSKIKKKTIQNNRTHNKTIKNKHYKTQNI